MLTKADKIVERVRLLSEIGPAGVPFWHGISLQVLQGTDPMADAVDLLALTEQEAEVIMDGIWEVERYDLIQFQDHELAVEVFTFGMVFGTGVAAWLLNEAVTKKIDKSYEMRQPDPGFSIDHILLSKAGRVIEGFRLLEAAYVGWLRRA